MKNVKMLSLFQVEEIGLTYNNKIRPADRIVVNRSSIAYEIFMAGWDMKKIELQEQAMMILLDHSCHCLGLTHLATGSIGNVEIDQRLLIATLLKARAVAFIFAHNHPTMTLKPSQADIWMTEKLCTSTNLLDIKFNDHLIVSSQGYYSFADNGIMPEPEHSFRLENLHL